MTYTFSTNEGTAGTVSIPVSVDTTGATLSVEFAYNSDFRSIINTKSIAGSGKNVTLSLTATDVDSMKNVFYRIKFTKDNKTFYVQHGAINYIQTINNDVNSLNIIDADSIPQRLGDASPGASNLASASDHVHPMPLLSDFNDFNLNGATDGQVLTYDAASGTIKPKAVPAASITPMWTTILDGEITLPRGHTDDSGSYGSTPVSGEIRLTYFRAQRTGSRNTVRFQTGGTGPTASTLARVGVYSVNESNNNLTLLASSANKVSFAGAYAGQNCALTTAANIVSGNMYAIGILQIATTPATVAGAWFNGTFMGANPKMARKVTGLTDLPATITTGFADTQFPVYCELVS